MAVKQSTSSPDSRVSTKPAHDQKRVGISVTCSVCGDMKKPVGRSGPMGMPYCEPRYPGERYGCDGYWREPMPGSLWPGETSEEFGYPVSANGTAIVEGR